MFQRILFFFFLSFCSILCAQESQCFDGIDNDGDGDIDVLDSDCGCYQFSTVGSSILTSNPPLTEYDNNYCFRITSNFPDQNGAIWLNNKIDLSQAFEFNAVIYAGENNFDGADGFAIVLQNESADAIGLLGGGLAYAGISPSIAFEIDTFDNNTTNGDLTAPDTDHANLSINGNQNEIRGTNTATGGSFIDLGNIENDQYYPVSIQWNPTIGEIVYAIDGQSIVYAVDLVTDIFSGENEVFFGFTGATGDFFNEQVICILESETFAFPDAGQSTAKEFCANEVTEFNLFDELGGTPDSNGQWTDQDGNIVNGGSYLGTINPVNNPGSYLFTYTVENNQANCANASATVELIILPETITSPIINP